MTVHITHGLKYHTDKDCVRMNSGEDLWDFDEPWAPTPGAHRRTVDTPATAAAHGKLPCLHCVPADQRHLPPSPDFGHYPIALLRNGFGSGPDICARCWIRHRSYAEAVLWPCTSITLMERTIAP